MNRILLAAVIGAALLASCAGGPEKQFLTSLEIPLAAETPRPSVVIDYKNKALGGGIPIWVSNWLEGGSAEIETLDAYQGRYTFVARADGNNFNALAQWSEGFSPDLDFPRLAAARIETRFSSPAPFPDNEYGSFFEALIRAVSDASWTGAVREDDFWIQRQFLPADTPGEDQDSQVNENWEFLILITIDKTLFTSQFNSIFQSIKASPTPTKTQIAAANKVKNQFYDGF